MKPVFPTLMIALMLNACNHVEQTALQDYLALAPAEPDVIKNKRNIYLSLEAYCNG